MITLTQLRAFDAVARHHGFTRAAEELQIAQPSVTYQIKTLERTLGIRLVEVVGRRVYLTEAGERLARRATALLNDLDEVEREMRAYREGTIGRVRIGATRTIGGYALPPALAAFHRKHPAIDLQLTIDNTEAIERLLLDRAIDCGVVEWRMTSPELAVRPLRRDRLILVGAPDHPLAARPAVMPVDLRGQPFILREPGSGTRALAESALGDVAPTLDVVLELAEPEAIVRAVESGLGLAFISESIVAGRVADGSLRELPFAGPLLERDFSFVTRRDRPRSPALRAFEAYLAQAWRDG